MTKEETLTDAELYFFEWNFFYDAVPLMRKFFAISEENQIKKLIH